MKKLYFAGAGIVILLLFSIWAKNADFNLRTMMQTSLKTLIVTKTPSNRTIPETQTSGQPATPTIPIEILITVTPNGFVPDVITITQGTKLTWVNKSGNDANVSYDPSFPHIDSLDLNLGNFSNNNSVSVTFIKAGRYHYYNQIQTAQRGTIVVQ